jgi:hypothetical protein
MTEAKGWGDGARPGRNPLVANDGLYISHRCFKQQTNFSIIPNKIVRARPGPQLSPAAASDAEAGTAHHFEKVARFPVGVKWLAFP